MSKSAIFLAAGAAAVGLAAPSAEALTPLSLEATADMSVEPDVMVGPSAHATMAPHEFNRAPDAAYEPTAVIANARAHLQCVPFVRQEAGIEIYGDANTWWAQARNRYIRAHSPQERAVLVLRGYAGASRGHVAVIKEIVSDRLIIVDHANWLNHGEITRDVPIRDVSPHGDWSQVQVWNVPGRHWGGRTYSVQGFILNEADPKFVEAAAAASEAATNGAQTPIG